MSPALKSRAHLYVQYYMSPPHKAGLESLLKFLYIQMNFGFYDRKTHVLTRKFKNERYSKATYKAFSTRGFNPTFFVDDNGSCLLSVNIDDHDSIVSLHDLIFRRKKKGADSKAYLSEGPPNQFQKSYYYIISKDDKFVKIFDFLDNVRKKLGIPRNRVLFINNYSKKLMNEFIKYGFTPHETTKHILIVDLNDNKFLKQPIRYYHHHNGIKRSSLYRKRQSEINSTKIEERTINYVMISNNEDDDDNGYHNFSIDDIVAITHGEYSGLRGIVKEITTKRINIKLDVKSMNLVVSIKPKYLKKV